MLNGIKRPKNLQICQFVTSAGIRSSATNGKINLWRSGKSAGRNRTKAGENSSHLAVSIFKIEII